MASMLYCRHFEFLSVDVVLSVFIDATVGNIIFLVKRSDNFSLAHCTV